MARFARCLKLKLFYGAPPPAEPVVSVTNEKPPFSTENGGFTFYNYFPSFFVPYDSVKSLCVCDTFLTQLCKVVSQQQLIVNVRESFVFRSILCNSLRRNHVAGSSRRRDVYHLWRHLGNRHDSLLWSGSEVKIPSTACAMMEK